MDLLKYLKNKEKENNMPLAARMRPQTLEDIIGQEEILGKDKLLYRMIKVDKLTSIILYGPPGTGKTSIANVIANTTKSKFTQVNATVSGKKDLEEIVKEAMEELEDSGKKTILFIDEIHRFNKAQQDFLLPYVEHGLLTLIGATTENPYFEVNKALLSRSRIFQLKLLTIDDVKELLQRAVSDPVKGMGSYNAEITNEALEFLANITGGDARESLNAIELAVLTTKENETGKIILTKKIVEECVQKNAVKYDKDGDNHYNTVSAFIKSMRGSDPDAAIYYLAKMLSAGEDIKFIARRIMICASEDVGNADPMALVLATNAALAAERVGMPEAQIILSQAVLYIATTKKSNSAITAIKNAMDYVECHKDYPVPIHLRDAHYKSAKDLGSGIGYKYPHDYPGHFVKQEYMPEEIKNLCFYNPSNYEIQM